MKIESLAFKNNEIIPKKYTCDGLNINPPLVLKDIPADTKTLALIMEDPDVPHSIRSDGMWDHWIMWNIPPETKIIAEGVPPAGVFGTNTGGTQKYAPPCPPNGTHRYFFKLFALDTELALSAGANKSQLLSSMERHILDEADLVGIYGRR
ncbi:MAG: YbhB/YbcL family Raf kinase inhibitor-like protein [Candidatus Paceibacterota bacterium]|jgi:hypothetical protein